MIYKLKEKIKAGEKVVGCFLGFYSPTMAEILGHTGFDFVVIDNEHGPFSWSEVEEMVRAAESANIVPIVRVAYGPSDIQKALDRGAQGIHVPMVNTKDQAEDVVRKAMFPPDGKRGTAYSCRSAQYGVENPMAYLKAANQGIMIAVHIETYEAVENIEAIMSVEGIDVCYIGPTDLSVTMGYAAEGPDHPEVQAAMERVLASGRKHRVTVGIQVGSAKAVEAKWNWGASYVGVGITAVLFPAFKQITALKNK